jgi:hypothetical protein
MKVRIQPLFAALSVGAMSLVFCSDLSAQDSVGYRVLATKKTSTMQKELQEAGDVGFEFVGVTVAKTLIGGEEVVSILRRKAR